MPHEDQNSQNTHNWSEYRRLVISELESINESISDINHSINKIDLRLNTLETRYGMIGGLFGAVGGIISAVIVTLVTSIFGK